MAPCKLKFSRNFVRELPADPCTRNISRQVEDACYSFVKPTDTANPKLIAVNLELAETLGISAEDTQADWFRDLMTGNLVDSTMKPYAMCYGGHQFGHWAGQLGDGRAINLGELNDQKGRIQTLQLKGAGVTPYSRTADGLAVLRSSIREYLCSEAMHHLGIPTTRALSLALSGDKVERDMFYDGRPKLEKGAIVCRVSPAFIRFGSFQIHAARNQLDILKQLANFTIEQNFSHLGKPSIAVYEAWFDEICQRTLALAINWMRVGFVHGVLNTDNMSILGETIDYGPYGWLEGFDNQWTPNTTDFSGRRYAYGNQVKIAHWNLFQLANAIAPLIGRVENLQNSLDRIASEHPLALDKMYAKKLGLTEYITASDKSLIDQLISIFSDSEIDFTIFFNRLSHVSKKCDKNDSALFDIVKPAYYLNSNQSIAVSNVKPMVNWLRQYQNRITLQNLDDMGRRQNMRTTNPHYVLRNYLVQQAIDKAEVGDYSEIYNLEKVMSEPYSERSCFAKYAEKRPEWARNKAGCSTLSCSS